MINRMQSLQFNQEFYNYQSMEYQHYMNNYYYQYYYQTNNNNTIDNTTNNNNAAPPPPTGPTGAPAAAQPIVFADPYVQSLL